MNYSNWEPPVSDNLELIKTQRQLKELSNPFLDGKQYFYDNGDKQIYMWNKKYLNLAEMEYVGKIKKHNKME